MLKMDVGFHTGVALCALRTKVLIGSISPGLTGNVDHSSSDLLSPMLDSVVVLLAIVAHM